MGENNWVKLLLLEAGSKNQFHAANTCKRPRQNSLFD
jgi:hypothetical protein